jgi:hypothetical protein
VEALELGSGIPDVPSHRRIRPGTLGVTEEPQVQLDQQK